MSLGTLLYFGTVVHADAVRQFPEVSEASNRSQLGLLRGFRQCGVERVVALTGLPIAYYPHRRAVVAGGMSWPSTACDPEIVVPRFANLAPVKPFVVHAALVAAGVRAAREGPVGAVLCYNPTPGYASAGLSVARRLDVPFVLLVADFEPPDRRQVAWRRAQSWWSLRILRASDGLVVHSGHVARDSGFAGPWVKIDGGLADDWLAPGDGGAAPESKTAMFAGTLAEYGGIRLLLDAFRLVRDPDMRLVVSGRGELEGEVRRAAAADSRIHHVGFVDRREMRRLLCSATVLVNPRLSRFRVNRYNFPSKLLDYMASGRPAITTLCGDLDEEYRSLCFPLEQETPRALAELLTEVCARPASELAEFGSQGQAFVISTRGWDRHAVAILSFLERLRGASRR